MKILVHAIVLLAILSFCVEPLVAQQRGSRRGPPPQGGRGGPGGPPSAGADDIPNEPVAKDDAERRILEVLDDMDANQRRGNMNVPKADGRLLRLLVETTGAKNVVEIGTSNGYSGIWFSLALSKTGGHLTTHEIDEDRAAMARENFKRAGVEEYITLVMGDAHENVKKLEGPIDIVFIDADKPGYPDYLEKLLPKVRPGGLIIGHNMRMPAPDPDYIKAITTSPALDTLFLNMQSSGIAVSIKKR